MGARITRCHVWHCFLTPWLASKRFRTYTLQSIAQLRHLSLQMASINKCYDNLDTVSGIVFLRQVWRQKATKLDTRNHLPNFNRRAFKFKGQKNFKTKHCQVGVQETIEGSNAEVVQLIAGMNFTSFLTPDMASKNDARHGIGLSASFLWRKKPHKLCTIEAKSLSPA